jgi:uncharacterized SAM-binding protein YcdF (DUF218 family)
MQGMYQMMVWKLLQPFTLLYIFSALTILNLWRRRRETRKRLLWLSATFVALTVLCLPISGHIAVGTLEWQNPPLRERPADAQAIVVLSSYVFPPDSLRTEPELDEASLIRCLQAAAVYHQGPSCPVLVAGGKTDPDEPGPGCSEVMRDFLVRLGVKEPDLIVENNSRTTYENAVEARKLLDEKRLHKIILVTDATHMVRSARCFRKQGLEVVPCGCRYRASQLEGVAFMDFLPSLSGARGCERAAHEWLGLAWYWLRDRI